MDEELKKMGITVSTVTAILEGVLLFLERMYVSAALEAFFAAYPEIKEDVLDLILAVKKLLYKISHL